MHATVFVERHRPLLFLCCVALSVCIWGSSPAQLPTSQPKIQTTVTATDMKTLTTAQTIELAALERRLTLLGVDNIAVKAFATSYVAEAEAQGHPGRLSPPTLQDLDRLETAIRDVSDELENAYRGRNPQPGFDRFKNNVPMFLARIQHLREHISRTNLAIPSEHYREFLDTIGQSTAELIEHREGNEDGTVLNPAPFMNYLPLYVLDLVVDIQIEPLSQYRRASPSSGYDIEMIDEAIRLSMNTVKPGAAVQPRYSVKH